VNILLICITSNLLMLRIPSLKHTFSHHIHLKTPFPTVNHHPAPYTGLAYEQIVKDRTTFMPNFYFHYYKKPLLIV
jgi:hypothetical protein